MIEKRININDFKFDEFVQDALDSIELECPEDIHPSYFVLWTKKDDDTIYSGPKEGRDIFKEQLYGNKQLFFPYLDVFDFTEFSEKEMKELQEAENNNNVKDVEDDELPNQEIYVGILMFIEDDMLVIKSAGRFLQENGNYGNIVPIAYTGNGRKRLLNYINDYIIDK